MIKSYKVSAALVSCIFILIVGCAPVRLVEGNDPKIEEGMVAYQQLLETTVQQTMVDYQLCNINQKALKDVEKMECDAATPEVQALCVAEIEAEQEQLVKAADKSCTAASFRESQKNFYIPQEAKLNVLKTRAAILDSMGACAKAMDGLQSLVDTVVPVKLESSLKSADVESGAPNCTVILVNTVLDNHRDLARAHQRIDMKMLADCESELPGACIDHAERTKQAGQFFPIMLETLMQNVRIVLFIEEAKKRGQTGT